MKLRTKYIVFVSILHLVALVLSYHVFKEDKPLFFVAEVLVLISLVLAWQLYGQLLQPLQTLMRGVTAIKERDFNIKFVRTGKFEMDQLIEVYNNMIDQLREERTRQEQQHFFLEKLIQTSPVGIIILDHDEKVEQLNPKAQEMLTTPEKQMIGRTVADLDLPIMQEIARLQPGKANTISLNGIQTFKLQKSYFVDRGFPRSFVMVEELTAELLAAEKNAYGKVIRMMAHEVNNTIGPVNSILQSTICKEELWQHQEFANLHNALQVAYNRNQNLNLFMRNYADLVRLPEPNKRNVDLHEIMSNVTTLMQLKAGEKEVAFILDPATSPFYIYADEQQMEQVLINIVKNAIEAIDQKGTIRFSVNDQLKQLAITDSGTGISKAHAAFLFSPFFSTKKDGQGVGLTLARQVLLNHGFQFSLTTKQQGETVFEILFN